MACEWAAPDREASGEKSSDSYLTTATLAVCAPDGEVSCRRYIPEGS
jgi:hypothetical protein